MTIRRLSSAIGSASRRWSASPCCPLMVADWVAGDFAIYFAYALFAVSLAFLWGHVGLLSLGHAVYFGIGAYAMGIVTLGMLPGLPGLALDLDRASRRDPRGRRGGGAARLVLLRQPRPQGRLPRHRHPGARRRRRAPRDQLDFLGGMNGLMNVPPITLGPNGDGPEIYDAVPLYYVDARGPCRGDGRDDGADALPLRRRPRCRSATTSCAPGRSATTCAG